MFQDNSVKKVVSQCLLNDSKKLTNNDLRNDKINQHLNNLKTALQTEYQKLSMEWLELCSKVECPDTVVKFKANLEDQDTEINNSFVELDLLKVKPKLQYVNQSEVESDEDL